MTRSQLLDLAVLTFRERDLSQPADADHFFQDYGAGNTAGYPTSPYERFHHYRDLLDRLRASDSNKFHAIHKGTPLYYLSWLAFDLHQFESALHFLDAAIQEDKRNAGSTWFDLPGPQFLMLNAPVQVARRTVEMLSLRVSDELNRFSDQYSVSFSRDLRRFAEPLLKDDRFAIIGAFYAFLLEFDDRFVEVQLRSSSLLGSYQPLYLHLFKGGILLETLLKHTFPSLSTSTLGEIFQHDEFYNRVGVRPSSIRRVSIEQLCAEATGTTAECAFQATGRLRNTMGHNLILDPLPNLPDDYVTLARREIDAFLYAVVKLYP